MPAKSKKKTPLSGERLAWFELAFHLHKTVEELKEQITHSEFLEWMEFLALERNKARKLDYYLAQIAFELRRSNVKNPGRVKLGDFLLKFVSRAVPSRMDFDPDDDEKYREHVATESKNAWFAALGGFNPGAN